MYFNSHRSITRRLLDYMLTLHLILWGTAKLIFQISYSNQQCMRVPIFPCPCHYLLLSLLFDHSHPSKVKWYLIVVLVCITLMTNNGEHLFMCILAISVSLLESVYSDPLPIFKLGYLSFHCWILRVLFISWILVPYQVCHLQLFSLILWIVSPSFFPPSHPSSFPSFLLLSIHLFFLTCERK